MKAKKKLAHEEDIKNQWNLSISSLSELMCPYEKYTKCTNQNCLYNHTSNLFDTSITEVSQIDTKYTGIEYDDDSITKTLEDIDDSEPDPDMPSLEYDSDDDN